MNSVAKLILLAAAFVVLLGGAWLGYSALSDKVGPQTGLIPDSTSQSESVSADESSGSSESESAAEASGGSESSDTQAAPDFTVYDADGNAAKLSDYAGKPVVINFWASWCPYCVQEMPDFQEVYDDYKDDVMFMMIDVTDGRRETKEKGEAHIEKNGFTFPVFFDTELDAAGAYGASSLPMTFVVDKDGQLVGYANGKISGQTLRDALDKLL